MHIKLPTHSIGRYRSIEMYPYDYAPLSERVFCNVALPLAVIEETDVEVPSYFTQLTRGHQSSVIHAKCDSVQYDDIDGFHHIAGYRPNYNVVGVINGRTRIVSTSVSYTREWIRTCQAWDFDPDTGYTCHLTVSLYESQRILTLIKNPTIYSGPYELPRCTSQSGQTKVVLEHDWDPTLDLRVYLDQCDALDVEYRTATTALTSEFSTGWKTPVIPLMQARFRFNEPNWVRGLGPLPNNLLMAEQDAFLKAMEQFPTMADNNIANIKDVGSMVLDICKGNIGNLFFKDIPSLWMWWRYSYSTTKSDVQQAIAYKSRQIITWLKPKRFDGNAEVRDLVSDTVGQVHCCFNVVQRTGDLMATLRHGLRVAGILPTAYRVWDLVPFSFVVDWFADVGDQLAAQELIDSMSEYQFSDMIWSLKYKFQDQNASTMHYTRWLAGVPRMDNYQWHSQSNPKTATWLKRAGDTIAMLTSSM